MFFIYHSGSYALLRAKKSRARLPGLKGIRGKLRIFQQYTAAAGRLAERRSLVRDHQRSTLPAENRRQRQLLDGQNSKVLFERNAANQITGYRVGSSFFKRLSNEDFPVKMWYPRYVAGGGPFEYKYAAPEKLDDGLTVGSIENAGLDAAAIKQMVEKIADGTHKNVHSVLIVKDGKLVVEEYFYEYDRDRLHQLRSTTKSFISALIGIAIEKGFIKSKNEAVLPFFPEYDPKNPSADKKTITIENLLTHQSGLDCDDDDQKSAGNELKMGVSPDWVKFTLDLPMNDKPGSRAKYCSGGVIVLGRIIEKATRKSISDFAAQHLSKPLGITNFQMGFQARQLERRNLLPDKFGPPRHDEIRAALFERRKIQRQTNNFEPVDRGVAGQALGR